MEFVISSTKLTGNPDGLGWAQVHDYKPESGEKLKKRGHIFAVISTDGVQKGVDEVLIGREILTRLHEEYFGSTEKSPFNALQDAISKVLSEFSDKDIGNVEIASVSCVEGVIYAAASGGSRVVLFRDGSLAKILESTKGETVSASGHPHENDVLLSATSKFFESFTDGVIKASLEGSNILKAAEMLTPTAHSKENSGDLGAVMIKFEKEGIGEELNQITDNKKVKEEDEVGSKSPSTYKPGKMSLYLRGITKRIPRRNVYVKKGLKEVDQKNKKTALSAGIILLILLIISIAFGVRQKSIKEGKMLYEDKLTQAEHNFEEAQTLVTLNPERARELFSESENTSNKLKSDGIEDERLETLISSLESQRGEILGEYNVYAELFVDPSLVSEGFFGTHLAGTIDGIALLDSNGKKVISTSVETKRSEAVSGPDQVSDAKDIAYYSERVFILDDEGIAEVSDEKKLLVEKDWSSDALIYAYTANLYLLDKIDSNIYRFSGTGDGFGSARKWFSESTQVDLSGATSFTIDGFVWISYEDGTVEKYTQGVFGGAYKIAVFPEISNIKSIYTNEELEYVYLLDSEKGRVVVIDKQGEFVAQYRQDGLINSKDLHVSEREETIIVLFEDGKLYSFDIDHIN